ncbi:hypothetical protein [Neptuniibacter sp. QD37_11]|uniref:hypothetical protein n=1 Tax=Neptuniibacter sp. QD37_11 TaxID=3398209 RepID=UPI0039F52A24
MTNKQQIYRVRHKVLGEGKHANQWMPKITDIKSLSELARFKHIVSVTPITLHIGEPLSKEQIEDFKRGNHPGAPKASIVVH